MPKSSWAAKSSFLFLLVVFTSACNDESASPSASVAQSSAASTTVPGNRAPELSGTPSASAAVEVTYRFQLKATDLDGDPLTVSITNLPSWATFDAASAVLSGRPSAEDIGTYDGIVLSASDGTTTTSLGPFRISVSDSFQGSATLTWAPPTENTDGTVLKALAGYKILYGMAADALEKSASILNPSVTRHVIENLSPGTWHFAIVAVNPGGRESDLSPMVSTTID